MFHPTNVSILAHADALNPTVAASEWVLDSSRRSGHSHVLVLLGGEGTVRLSNGELQAAGPSLVWMPAGAARSTLLQPGSEAHVLSLSENLVSLAIARSGNSAALRATADRLVHATGRRSGSPEMLSLAHASETIHRELRQPADSGVELVAACVTVILVNAQRLADFQPLPQPAGDWAAPQLLQRFLQAVEVRFREQFSIRSYAAQLGVTERRLHNTVRKATGRSPLALVHARMLDEARARLEETSLPVAQIAYGLGFRDPAHFTRFFRNAVGVSPRRYRLDARQVRLEGESYASWP